MKQFAAVLLIAGSFIAHPVAQSPGVPAPALKNSARISGRVVAAATGRPLVRATVRARALVNPPVERTVRTDLNGQYAIADLPAGRYSFVVSRTGYLEQNFDQPSPLARYRLLELAESEQLDDVNFSLHRGAVITGVITDEAGDPLPDVHVETMREIFGPGGRAFAREFRTPVPIQTDDEGRYRVYGLRPGTYVVTATVRAMDDSPAGFGRTYYPGTMNESEAQTVRVDLGLAAVADFSMIPARHARVSGVVRDSQGRAAAGARIMVYEMRGSRFEPTGGHILTDDGSFEFERMLPGSYMLHVRPPRGAARIIPATAESATLPLKVTDEDMSDLIITMSTGFAVSGRVTFEGGTTPVIKGLRIGARETDVSFQAMDSFVTPENGLVDAANRFTIAGVRGKVRVGGGGGGWFTKRVFLKGNDATTGFDVSDDVDGIEIVLTHRATTITGTVRDARGIGRNDFIVAFFPVGQFDREERAARQRTIRPDLDGVYRIRNLPPGDYLAAAVPAMSLSIDGEWDPAFFARVRPGATSFTLDEGQSVALNLPLIE